MGWLSLMEQEETRFLTRMPLSNDPVCTLVLVRDQHQREVLWAKVTSLQWSLTRWVKQVRKLSSCPRLSLRRCAFSETISAYTWKSTWAKIRWSVSSRLVHESCSLEWRTGKSEKSLLYVSSTSTCMRVFKGVVKAKLYLKRCSIEKVMCIRQKLPTIGHLPSWLAFCRNITDLETTFLKTTILSFSVSIGIRHSSKIFTSLLHRQQQSIRNNKNLLVLWDLQA